MKDMIERQKAIDALKEKRNSAKEWYEEASASGDEMMLSRAESAMMTFVECILTIKKLPSAHPEIIICRDCKHSMNNENGEPWICNHPNNNAWNITPDHYCGYAERRTDGSD